MDLNDQINDLESFHAKALPASLSLRQFQAFIPPQNEQPQHNRADPFVVFRCLLRVVPQLGSEGRQKVGTQRGNEGKMSCTSAGCPSLLEGDLFIDGTQQTCNVREESLFFFLCLGRCC